jgi:hypothetical protein
VLVERAWNDDRGLMVRDGASRLLTMRVSDPVPGAPTLPGIQTSS